MPRSHFHSSKAQMTKRGACELLDLDDADCAKKICAEVLFACLNFYQKFFVRMIIHRTFSMRWILDVWHCVVRNSATMYMLQTLMHNKNTINTRAYVNCVNVYHMNKHTKNTMFHYHVAISLNPWQKLHVLNISKGVTFAWMVTSSYSPTCFLNHCTKLCTHCSNKRKNRSNLQQAIWRIFTKNIRILLTKKN